MKSHPLHAIIVDDEKEARDGLQAIIDQYIDGVEVLGRAANVEEARPLINQTTPDIVFLDIIMPGGNSFQLLENINHYEFEIIFTTAYNDYAIRAIKFSALDYLLKPIDIEELQHAIQKARENLNKGVSSSTSSIEELQTNLDIASFGKVAIPTSDGLNIVQTQNIVYVEASGSYSRLHFSDSSESLLVSKRLGEFEELLQAKPFFRVNRSYLININCVAKYTRTDGGFVIMSDGAAIDVPSKTKNKLLATLGQL